MPKTKKPAPSKPTGKPKQKKNTGPCCAKCKKPVDDGSFCHGCNEYLCDDCDKAGITLPFGPHGLEDHDRIHEEEVEDDDE